MRKQVTIKTLPTEHRKVLGFLLSACVIRKLSTGVNPVQKFYRNMQGNTLANIGMVSFTGGQMFICHQICKLNMYEKTASKICKSRIFFVYLNIKRERYDTIRNNA